jgi:hypothetical protein
MWFSKFVKIFRTSSPERYPQKIPPDSGGVSFVKASLGSRRHKPKECVIDKNVWLQTQREQGRFVIHDAHFNLGYNMRSVPKIGPIDDCTLMKRVNENVATTGDS